MHAERGNNIGDFNWSGDKRRRQLWSDNYKRAGDSSSKQHRSKNGVTKNIVNESNLAGD